MIQKFFILPTITLVMHSLYVLQQKKDVFVENQTFHIFHYVTDKVFPLLDSLRLLGAEICLFISCGHICGSHSFIKVMQSNLLKMCFITVLPSECF